MDKEWKINLSGTLSIEEGWFAKAGVVDALWVGKSVDRYMTGKSRLDFTVSLRNLVLAPLVIGKYYGQSPLNNSNI